MQKSLAVHHIYDTGYYPINQTYRQPRRLPSSAQAKWRIPKRAKRR